MIKPVLCAAILTAVPFATFAHEYKIGDLVINHPMAIETPKTAMAGAAYMTITNTGTTTDRLIAVEADFPRVMLHDTKIEDDIATMTPLDGVEIAPGETVSFEPGGMHLMFMGLQGDPFEVGEKVPATLTFEKAGQIEVTFNVEAMEDAMDHSNHDVTN